MSRTLRPHDEARRLEVIREIQSAHMGNLAELLHPLVRLSAHICGAPCSFVTIVEETMVRTVAVFGESGREVPRERSISSTAILGDEPVVIRDIRQDSRFWNLPPFTDGAPALSFAGVPFRLEPHGPKIGVLGVVDEEARSFDSTQILTLQTLANQAGALIRGRLLHHEAELNRARLEALLDSVPAVTFIENEVGCVAVSSRKLREELKFRHGLLLNSDAKAKDIQGAWPEALDFRPVVCDGHAMGKVWFSRA